MAPVSARAVFRRVQIPRGALAERFPERTARQARRVCAGGGGREGRARMMGSDGRHLLGMGAHRAGQ